MRVYALSALGRRVTQSGSGGDAEEMRILNYLRDNGTATDDQLEVIGERWTVRKLKSRGLIRELTT